MLLTLLSACGGGDDPMEKAVSEAKVEKNSPNAAFISMIQAMKSNDVKALMQASMSNEDFQNTVADFEEKKSAVTESQKAQFEQTMGMLTTQGSVDVLMAMVSPQLEQLRSNLPKMLMQGKLLAGPMIQSSPDISQDQKENLTKVANAFIDFASNPELLSEEVTLQAITTAVDTAKSLNMNTLDDLQNMSFDQAMNKASIVMGGTKNILNVYGISIDDMLNSIEVSEVEENGDSAKMKIAYEFFGESFNQEVKMKKVNGQWLADQQP